MYVGVLVPALTEVVLGLHVHVHYVVVGFLLYARPKCTVYAHLFFSSYYSFIPVGFISVGGDCWKNWKSGNFCTIGPFRVYCSANHFQLK